MPWGVWKWRPEGGAALTDLDSDDARARVAALEAVATWQNPDGLVLERVAARLDDHLLEVRLAAVVSVGALKYDVALPKLDAIIATRSEDEADLDLIRAAIEAVGRIGGLSRLPAIRALGDDEEPEIRYQAEVALAELLGHDAGPELMTKLRDSDPYVRWGAAAALGDIEYREGIDDIAVLLDEGREEPAEVRFEVALTLGRLGDRRGVPELAMYTQHRLRGYQCCELLGRLGDERAVVGLTKAWKGLLTNQLIRVRAAASLAELGVTEARRSLWKMTRSRRYAVRELAIELVGEVGGDDARDLLEQASRRDRTSAAAARGLALMEQAPAQRS
ncbi:MAG: HEAT repeat domain-containing protein [Deltaproteobacteria bacterium]|nr:HEAT repeat domain-containing protein [Deltaproteobacteria bacterium]